MEYERIHKVQMGVISPSKLRMKLLGVQNHRRKEGANNSSRTSPSKLEDLEYAKNSLLANEENESSKDCEGESGFLSTTGTMEHQVTKLHRKCIPNFEQNVSNLKAKMDTGDSKIENTPESVLNRVHSLNTRTAHAVRLSVEENNGYDSGHDNGSTSSFEFHRGERILQSPVVGPFSRPVPSKWNDAEKWIVNRQPLHPHATVLKKTLMQQRQANHKMNANMGKVAPESATMEQGASSLYMSDTKNIDSYLPQTIVALPNTRKELNQKEVSIVENSDQQASVPAVKSVSMRDMGTEMTPVASQEPSRTATPNGSMTPILSPLSSGSTTPRRDEMAPPSFKSSDYNLEHKENNVKKELSERERKLKTRKEILALGLQLGKANIAAWARKDNLEDDSTSHDVDEVHKLKKMEFEARAAAWEEAEKTRHMARFKSEEVKIQVWESHQRARFEAQMKEVEAHAERMKANAQERMMKKLSSVKQHSQEKLARAEARKNRQATITAQQVEHIRQTGEAPPSSYYCCPWFS